MMVTHEGTEVPQAFHDVAIERGAILVKGGTTTMKMLSAERKNTIRDAVKTMAAMRSKGDLDWNGAINLQRLIARVGFSVYQEEADAALKEVMEEPVA